MKVRFKILKSFVNHPGKIAGDQLGIIGQHLSTNKSDDEILKSSIMSLSSDIITELMTEFRRDMLDIHKPN